MKTHNKIILNVILGIISPVIYFIIHYSGLYLFTGSFVKNNDVFENTISLYVMGALLFLGTSGIPIGLFLLFNKNYDGYIWIMFLLFGLGSGILLYIYPF